MPADLEDGRAETIARLTAVATGDLPVASVDVQTLLDRNWRSSEVGALALAMWPVMAPSARPLGNDPPPSSEVRRELSDGRGRRFELVIRFEPGSARAANVMVRPVLAPGVTVREVTIADADALVRLERAAPLRRDDGTQITVTYGGAIFERDATLQGHRLLGAWSGADLLAVQGVNTTRTTVGDRTEVVAHNHYSRSDPATRQAGNLLHLIATHYFDVFPRVDRYLSFVDPANSAGMRLALGLPWSAGVQRVFLSVEALRASTQQPPELIDAGAAHVDRLLHATHGGNTLWGSDPSGSRTESAMLAGDLPRGTRWLSSERAVLAVWHAGERRTYRRADSVEERRIALAVRYGYEGAAGRDELRGLFVAAARGPELTDATHLAVFCAETDPRTGWIYDEASGADAYLVCGSPVPDLNGQHVFVDPVAF